MSDYDTDIRTLTALEQARCAAIVDGDYDAFAALSHPELRYTHTSGETDTLDSYLQKCRSGYYDYHRIDRPITRITIVGDTALILGEFHSELSAGGIEKELHASALAVWIRDGDSWLFLGYQPTLLPK
jgi:hypothetical protein